MFGVKNLDLPVASSWSISWSIYVEILMKRSKLLRIRFHFFRDVYLLYRKRSVGKCLP